MIPRKRLFVLVPVCAAVAIALWPAEASAQRRGYRGPSRSVFVGARFASPIYPYPSYYDSFWWDSSYAFQYRYPPYAPYRYDVSADLRTQVTPKNAEVYIDGYLVGTVDDFDGVLQRLRVPLGEHEITLYEPGYQPFREKMLFRPYESYHIKQSLKPLASGDTPEPRPAPSSSPQPSGPPTRGAMQGPVPRERNAPGD
ncbi:MAG: PEGA domain-containing protein, partial [Acidobacteriota bacterium]